MMDDGLDDLLSQAVDRCVKEEVDLDDGLDGILSQSLDIFEQKSLDDDAIDITDMFESGGPSLQVMARRFRIVKGNPLFTAMVTYSFHLYSRSSHHFIQCFLSRVDELNKLAGSLQCMGLHGSAGRALQR